MYFLSVVRKETLTPLFFRGNVLLGRASLLNGFYRQPHKCLQPAALGYRHFIYATSCLYSSTVDSTYGRDERLGGEIKLHDNGAGPDASYRCSVYSSSLAFFVRPIDSIDRF